MLRSLGIDTTTAFHELKNLQAIPCLASYHHKSTQSCLPHCLDGQENWSQEFPQGEGEES
jgi:hypothetical protein